ncbi:hypothetical protein LguiA_022748 [Lonicera macranthoides]
MGAPEVELTNFVNAIKKYLSEHVELPKPNKPESASHLLKHPQIRQDGLVIDWSDSGRVSQVRDQKSASKCTLPSAYMIQQKTEGIRLNIQELVDEFGIDSGEVENAFEYIQNNGLSPESECRWTGRVRTKRRHVKDQIKVMASSMKLRCLAWHIQSTRRRLNFDPKYGFDIQWPWLLRNVQTEAEVLSGFQFAG